MLSPSSHANLKPNPHLKMPKPTQIIALGAIVAGGAYYYDQNVQPIWSNHKVPPIEDDKKPPFDLKKIDSKTKELGNKLTNRFEEQKKEIESKTKNSSLFNQVKEEPKDNRTLPIKLADKYIDVVNSFGESTTAKTKELNQDSKNLKSKVEDESKSWFNWFDSKKKDEQANLEASKEHWFDWGASKQDQLTSQAEEEKKNWLNWGSAKKDEVNDQLNDVKDWNKSKLQEADETRLKYQQQVKDEYDVQAKKFNDTLSKEKKAAIDQYNSAKHNLEDLTSKLSSKTSSLFGSKEEVSEKEKANAHLNQAKKDFEDSLNNLKKFGDDFVKHIDQNYYVPLKKDVHNLDK